MNRVKYFYEFEKGSKRFVIKNRRDGVIVNIAFCLERSAAEIVVDALNMAYARDNK